MNCHPLGAKTALLDTRPDNGWAYIALSEGPGQQARTAWETAGAVEAWGGSNSGGDGSTDRALQKGFE
jgi:hypothetical protein